MATGRKNGLTIEVYGDRGSLSFDLERLNELQRARRAGNGTSGAARGCWSPRRTTRTSTPGGRPATCSAGTTPSPRRPPTSSTAIAAGTAASPSFADGLAVQRVLAAIEEQCGSLGCHGSTYAQD